MTSIEELLQIMATLRDPEQGCPWDREQNFSTLAHYTLEEAYEVVEAIELGQPQQLRDELGDLLFQVVFHAQLASELGQFEFADVVASICAKMIRRHPHVFANQHIASAAEQTAAWEQHKQAERLVKQEQRLVEQEQRLVKQEQRQEKQPAGDNSILAGVTGTLPATTRAIKLQKRAATVGFDWPSIHPIFDKVVEELEETRVEVLCNDRDAMEDEIGDLLFAVTNLARHAQIDPETALRRSNRKFEARFRGLERLAAERGLDLKQQSQGQLEALWQEIKFIINKTADQ